MTTEAIPIHLSPLLFYVIVLGFAVTEARSDFDTISAGIDVNHTERWTVRAICVAVTASPWIVYVIGWGFALALLGSAAFGFSALFRWRLNGLRGKHPCYVSPSSWYDSLFLSLTWWPVQREGLIEDWHMLMDRQRTRRAGRLAYVVEAVLFTAGAAYVFINIPTQ